MPISTQRIDALEKRMDKYDEILDELRAVVTRLETRYETNHKWLMGIGSVCLTLSSGAVGILLSHLIFR